MCTAIPRDPRHFLCIEFADEFRRSTYSGLNSQKKKEKKKKKRTARAAVSFSCAVKLALPSTVTVALYLFYFIYLFFLHISPPAEPLIYLKQNGLSCRCDTLHNTISLVGGGRRAKRCNKKNTRPPVGIGTPGNNSITEGCLGKTKTRQLCLPDKSNVLRFFFFKKGAGTSSAKVGR